VSDSLPKVGKLDRVQIWVSAQDCCTKDALWTMVDDVEASGDSIRWAETEAMKQLGQPNICCSEVHHFEGKSTKVIHRFGRSGNAWQRLPVKCPEPAPGDS